MKIIKAGFEVVTPINGMEILKSIEQAGRVCYKSEDQITEDSATKFLAGIIKRGHEAVLEHQSITVKFIVDRGVSHEIVRHRLAAYCQESTRYCNYSKNSFGSEITVIEPCFLVHDTPQWAAWESAMKNAEFSYFRMLDLGCSPQEARSVLPNSLKTEVVMTANIREWRHFFKLRCAPAAHPQMREVAIPLLEGLKQLGWDGKKDEKGRTLLQYVGTDKIRAQSPDYWVDFIVGILSMFPDEWDYVLIPDTRFPNEFEIFKNYGMDASLLRVERPNFVSPLTDKQQMHPSETALDNYHYDLQIINDGTLEDLQTMVAGLIQRGLLDWTGITIRRHKE